MRLINTIEGYHICGENRGAFIDLQRFYQNLVYSNNKMRRKKEEFTDNNHFYSYEELEKSFIKRTKKENYSGFEWFNIFELDTIEEKLRELIIEMFNPEKTYKVWGYKEIRYGKSNYNDFESELNFLKTLFSQAKFIFNTRNIDDIVKSAWWKKNEQESRKVLTQKYEFFMEYHNKYPDFTYHIQYENMINDTLQLRGMYDFLGEDFSNDKYQAVLTRV